MMSDLAGVFLGNFLLKHYFQNVNPKKDFPKIQETPQIILMRTTMDLKVIKHLIKSLKETSQIRMIPMCP